MSRLDAPPGKGGTGITGARAKLLDASNEHGMSTDWIGYGQIRSFVLVWQVLSNSLSCQCPFVLADRRTHAPPTEFLANKL